MCGRESPAQVSKGKDPINKALLDGKEHQNRRATTHHLVSARPSVGKSCSSRDSLRNTACHGDADSAVFRVRKHGIIAIPRLVGRAPAGGFGRTHAAARCGEPDAEALRDDAAESYLRKPELVCNSSTYKNITCSLCVWQSLSTSTFKPQPPIPSHPPTPTSQPQHQGVAEWSPFPAA